MPSGLRESRMGPGYHLSLRLSGAGYTGIRTLLLKSVCIVLVERGRDGNGLRAGAEAAGEDALLIRIDAGLLTGCAIREPRPVGSELHVIISRTGMR
jgi:hypothetical protein